MKVSRIRHIFFVVCALSLFCVLTCAHANTNGNNNSDENGDSYSYLSDDGNGAQAIKDPYEKFNRAMFTFNDKLDKYALKPIAKGYDKIMPRPASKGVSHFFKNLGTLPTIANDLLQGNFYQATSDSWNFLLNSTVGIGGLFDVAPSFGLSDNKEDFGLTLAKWGYLNSDYFVIPFLGPSTIRDAVARPVDYLSSFYTYVDDVALRNSMEGLKIIDKRAQLLRFQDTYQALALDPYVLMRSAYFQRRNYLIERNKSLSDPYTEEDMEKVETDYYLDE